MNVYDTYLNTLAYTLNDLPEHSSLHPKPWHPSDPKPQTPNPNPCTGDMDALHNLAICFLNGHGCVKDPATAAELFLEAAEAGSIESMSAVSAWSILRRVFPLSSRDRGSLQ
jgi:TPR repeat protein